MYACAGRRTSINLDSDDTNRPVRYGNSATRLKGGPEHESFPQVAKHFTLISEKEIHACTIILLTLDMSAGNSDGVLSVAS